MTRLRAADLKGTCSWHDVGTALTGSRLPLYEHLHAQPFAQPLVQAKFLADGARAPPTIRRRPLITDQRLALDMHESPS